MTATLDQKLNAIRSLVRDMDRPAISIVYRILREESDRSSQMAALAFRVGDVVRFNAGKLRGTIKGTVESINRKTVTVRASSIPHLRWRVGATLLHKLEPLSDSGKAAFKFQEDVKALTGLDFDDR